MVCIGFGFFFLFLPSIVCSNKLLRRNIFIYNFLINDDNKVSTGDQRSLWSWQYKKSSGLENLFINNYIIFHFIFFLILIILVWKSNFKLNFISISAYLYYISYECIIYSSDNRIYLSIIYLNIQIFYCT